jgi:hypothetical protein
MARLAAVVRDESAIAWTAPDSRAHLTSELFGRSRTYAPGGTLFALGLQPWEQELLAPPFPPAGRVLLGGAGGGREAIALLDRGYDVIAFDPADDLVRAGAPAVAERGGTLLRASYDDVVRAASGAASPLTEHLDAPIDGVLFGWGSLSHVIADADRLALLRAVRSLAPRAPVALSFDEPVETEPSESGAARARRALRRIYHGRGAPGYTGERIRYAPWAGILRESTPGEVEAVAVAAGYRVEKQGLEPARMLLMPRR